MEQLSAKQRIIKDIKNDDIRIQITGYIKEISPKDNLILDDKSGEIKVGIKNVDVPYKKNHLINVIGNLEINIEGEKGVEADIIQDMNKLNFEYYQKLYHIKKEL